MTTTGRGGRALTPTNGWPGAPARRPGPAALPLRAVLPRAAAGLAARCHIGTRSRWVRLVAALGAGTLGGLGAGWLHQRLGVTPAAGLFVAGLPWPFPVALDAMAAVGVQEGWVAALATLLALRAGVLLLLLRLAASGVRVGRWWTGAAVALPALAALPVALAGLVAGPLAAAAALAGLVAAWAWLAATACGRRPGWRPVAAGLAVQAAAVLLTPSGPADPLPALTDPALGGMEGALLVLLVLSAARARDPAGPGPGRRNDGRDPRSSRGRAGPPTPTAPGRQHVGRRQGGVGPGQSTRPGASWRGPEHGGEA